MSSTMVMLFTSGITKLHEGGYCEPKIYEARGVPIRWTQAFAIDTHVSSISK